jgi:hypothetical protein
LNRKPKEIRGLDIKKDLYERVLIWWEGTFVILKTTGAFLQNDHGGDLVLWYFNV